MALVKWEPMQELAKLHDEMDRIFGRSLGEASNGTKQMWNPLVDVREEDGNIVVKADMPGVKKENVTITATEDSITIQGKSQEETEDKKDNYYRRERRCGSFHRVLSLPATIDADKAQASFQDGTVTITLPKIEQTSKAKTINVQ
jgi:HSP20 family protein